MTAKKRQRQAEVRAAREARTVARTAAAARAAELSPWLTEIEAAAYLKRSIKTLQNWRITGKGPQYSQPGGPGTAVTYYKPTLDAWSLAGARSSTTQAPAEPA